MKVNSEMTFREDRTCFQRAQQHLRSHRPVAIFPVLILGLLFVGLTATLAACGTAQVQRCGQVHTLNGHFSESADSVKQAENCFWQAFQRCNAAMLTFEANGIDAGIIHTFTIVNNNGACSVSDATQHYIAPNPPQAGNTYMCTGLMQQADGLHFSGCGDEGNVVVPALSTTGDHKGPPIRPTPRSPLRTRLARSKKPTPDYYSLNALRMYSRSPGAISGRLRA